jgi:hypothetical protein
MCPADVSRSMHPADVSCSVHPADVSCSMHPADVSYSMQPADVSCCILLSLAGVTAILPPPHIPLPLHMPRGGQQQLYLFLPSTWTNAPRNLLFPLSFREAAVTSLPCCSALVPALQFGAPKASLSACQLSPFNSFIRNGNEFKLWLRLQENNVVSQIRAPTRSW